MIDGKTTIGEIKDKVLNNGFDLIKDSAYRIKDKVERGKDEGLRIKDKEGKEEREREREREEKEKLQSRDRACPVLKLQKQEVDSQLKVFFGELKEIKAVIRDTRSSILDTRKKKKNGKRTLDSDKRVSSIEKRPLKKGRKMKFRPEITRVKLNPEQAVLSCGCYSLGLRSFRTGGYGNFARGANAYSAPYDSCVGKSMYRIYPFRTQRAWRCYAERTESSASS